MAAKTILLVDDDPEILAAMRVSLVNAGYRIVTAEDGNMGLALAERENPALVVVDMMIPKKKRLRGRRAAQEAIRRWASRHHGDGQ